MTRLHYNVPAAKEQKPWKKRISGVLVMLTKGYNKRSGRLRHELIAEIKEKFNYRTDRAIRDIWNKHKQQIMSGDPINIERKQGSGRPLKYLPDDLQARIKNVPLLQRRTLRSLAFHSGLSPATLLRYISRGFLARSTSSVKPKLTPTNVQARKDYCLGKVDADRRFNDMMIDIHVDEKWFYVMRVQDKYNLLPEEVEDVELLYRSCDYKRHIAKVIFGMAVARPQQNPETGE